MCVLETEQLRLTACEFDKPEAVLELITEL